jgi:hypothetical protein
MTAKRKRPLPGVPAWAWEVRTERGWLIGAVARRHRIDTSRDMPYFPRAHLRLSRVRIVKLADLRKWGEGK